VFAFSLRPLHANGTEGDGAALKGHAQQVSDTAATPGVRGAIADYP
jgi:hypothetical protein